MKIITSLGYLLVTVIAAVTVGAIQSNDAEIKNLRIDMEREITQVEDRVVALEAKFAREIARLDEALVQRRNLTASLEVSLADSRALIEELRRDVERLIPQDTD